MTEIPSFDELEDLRHCFSLRLRSIHSLVKPSERQETGTRRYTHREKPTTSNGDPSVKEEASVSVGEKSVEKVGLNDEERGALLERLRTRIQGIREETGSIKIQKVSHHVKQSVKEARKQHRRRRSLAKNKTKNRNLEIRSSTGSLPSTQPTGLSFSEVRSRSGLMTGNRPGKRKLSEKFRKLKIAKRQQETTQRFQQTGDGGQKVLEIEWNHAFRRASGQRVLDDPRKIQKSIDDRFKKKIRSAKQWKARLEATEKVRTERQQRRKANLGRRHQCS